MAAYIIRRLLFSIPILIGVNLLVFMLFFLVNTPDDMARQALGDKASQPEQLKRWKIAHGYQYPKFWNRNASGTKKVSQTIFYQKSLRMFWGDFGRTDMTMEPISRDICSRIGPSLFLTIPIFLVSLLLNVFFSLFLAARRGTVIDFMGQFYCVILMSISTLIYIIAGQFCFAKLLHLVPVSGFATGFSMVKFLILPIFIGILSNLGSGIRFYRTLFLEEINKDYVRTAKAKGLSTKYILWTHVLKNAMIPILTNLPLQILWLIMGNLLLENFFGIPGLGSYTINAIASQDFAIVRAMVFLGSVLYIFGILLADISYSFVDPRIRLE